MGYYLTKLWTDPAYFRAVSRGIVVGFVGAFLKGQITLPQPFESWMWSLAPFLAAVAVGIPAGQSNPSPEQIKSAALDPSIIPSATVTPSGASIAAPKP